MKKIIIAMSLCLLFTGCKKEKKKIDVKYNKIKAESLSTKKDSILKEGKIGNMFEIEVLKAQKLDKKNIKDKLEIKNDKSYLLLEYKIRDMRNDPSFNQIGDFLNIISTKVKDARIVERNYVKEEKTEAVIKEIVEVQKIGEKIDLEFMVEDEKLNMTIIL